MHSDQSISRGKPDILYTRREDGGRRIEVLPFGYQVGPEGGPIYTSVRSLLESVAGPGRRHWTFDRYFRLGSWSESHTPMVAEVSIAEICPRAPTVASEGLTVAPSTRGTPLRPGLTVGPSKGPTGIDLKNRAHEVRKLLFAGFGTRIFAAGYDPEDVLQEVYRGLLARNVGKCAWDASKSSFGHYVHMVCGCILSNFHRRENRRRSVEQVGLPTVDGEDHDVSEVAVDHVHAGLGMDPQENMASDLVKHLESAGGPDAHLAVEVLPLLQAGLSRTEISDQLGRPKADIARALAHLKAQASSWLR